LAAICAAIKRFLHTRSAREMERPLCAAGPGAALGGAIGASQGSVQAQAKAGNAQRCDDIACLQCMCANGNAVPVLSS
jgi:hypothetical protein